MFWLPSVSFAVTPDLVTNPRPNGWVSDMANVLDPKAEADLEARLDALHRDLDVEVEVVTVEEVHRADGHVHVPKEFATELFNRWEIGDKDANNGLLVLLVVDARRLEMETGYGLEPILSDGWLGGIQTNRMVPQFKAGDYGQGLQNGMVEVDARLRKFPEDARLGTRGPVAVARDTKAVEAQRAQEAAVFRREVALGGGATGLVALGVLGAVGTSRYRRRQRTCEKCNVYMPMLSEDDDDAHLTTGQRAEERLGSVDHQVHQCPQCGDVRAFASVSWFSGYGDCPRCEHRTKSSSSQTVRHATRSHGGLVEVTETCRHCNYRNSYERRTAPLPPPSSNHSSHGNRSSGGGFGGGGFGGGGFGGGGGGSSGGSTGGGRSGGGGAGSSW